MEDGWVVPGLALGRAALDRARLSRDVRFDGRFFVAVASTGVYCRPICPRRTPKSQHVRYYRTAAAATEAGFRPCLRCRPEAAPSSAAWLGDSAVVRRALRLIEHGAVDDGSIDALAARLGLGSRHLRRLFVKHVGASPVAVAQTRRLQFAKRLIDDTDLPVTTIALEAGYGSLRRFNAAFRSTYGHSPRDLRGRRAGKAAARRSGRSRGIVLRLPYRPPYDWQGTLDFLAARQVPELEDVRDGRFACTIVHDGQPACIVIRSPRKVDALELEFHGVPGGALFNLVGHARRMFDLAVDPERVAAVLGGDPLLAETVRRYPGLRIPGEWDDFACAVRALLGQGSATREQRLTSRLVRSCGERISASAAAGLPMTHLFPTAQALAVANFTGIGLTDSQAGALRALANAYLQRRLDFAASAEELVATLVSLPGMSAELAEYVALRALGEPDAFPEDYGRFGMTALPGSPHAESSFERSLSWRPWRGYAALYLWRAHADGQARPDRPSNQPLRGEAKDAGARPLAFADSTARLANCP